MKCLFLLFGLLSFVISVSAQDPDLDPIDSVKVTLEERKQRLAKAQSTLDIGLENHVAVPRNNKGVRVAFYNAENLFWPEKDSTKRDGDFTPRGIKGWSFYRYNQKLYNIYKVVMAIGCWEPPAVVGFCEVENMKCLKDLIYKTPLKKFGYKVVHEESPDRRGIDVGLIYRPDKFKYITHESIRVT